MKIIIGWDVTNKNANQPHDRAIWPIWYDDDYAADEIIIYCEEYDYILNADEFETGIEEGWLKIADNDYKNLLKIYREFLEENKL